MRPRLKSRNGEQLPGQAVTVRTHRDFRMLLDRVEEGDLVVIERRDLDAAAARRLAARRPAAVLNAVEFVSGRFANLGPSVLLEAGVQLLEADPDGVRRLRSGDEVRLDGDTLHAGSGAAIPVHRLTADEVRARMDRARAGMASQLDTFAHTASEFLRQEEGLLLHGAGLPDLRTELAGRTVVVVGPQATASGIRRLSAFLREQRPVIVAVDAGAELLRRRRRRPDVLVLGADAAPTDGMLRRAREVVLHGAGEGVRRRVEKIGLPAHDVTTGASSTDVALLLAHAAGARLVVPVGDPATLEELIDRERSDQASTVLTRMRLGDTVVDASSVPLLYTGRVRIWQLLLVLLAALAVFLFAVAVTPIGNDAWHDLVDGLPGWLDWLGGGS